jgi:acyltransferase
MAQSALLAHIPREAPAILTPCNEGRRDSGVESAVLAFKGICIIGVVSHHMNNRRFAPDARQILDFIPSQLFPWVVLAFMLAAGYLQSVSDKNRGSSDAGLWQLVKRRARRLLVPFLVLAGVYSLAAVAWAQTGLGGEMGPSSFLVCWTRTVFAIWFMMNGQPAGGGIGEQLYFFPLLFLTSVMCGLGLRLLPSEGAKTLLVAVLWLGVLVNAGLKHFEPGMLSMSSLFYLTGYVMRLNQDYCAWMGFGCALLIILMAVADPPSVRLLAAPLLLMLAAIRSTLTWRPIMALGDAAGTIFAYHVPLLLTPLLHLSARLATWEAQLAAAFGSAASVIVALTWLHSRLKGTRMRCFLL